MRYRVYVCRRENKQLHESALAAGNDDFFNDEEKTCVKFSKEQALALDKRLKIYGYELESVIGGCREYCKEDILAYLTDTALYFIAFSTNSDDTDDISRDDIFDIMLTASEFCDSEEFAKYDPQLGAWETWEEEPQ